MQLPTAFLSILGILKHASSLFSLQLQTGFIMPLCCLTPYREKCEKKQLAASYVYRFYSLLSQLQAICMLSI